MQLINSSAPDGFNEAGVPRGLVEAIANELWALYGESGRLDWERVERHLSIIVEQAVELARYDTRTLRFLGSAP
jgi:hypothetical protein